MGVVDVVPLVSTALTSDVSSSGTMAPSRLKPRASLPGCSSLKSQPVVEVPRRVTVAR
jgi:hypothetical protein